VGFATAGAVIFHSYIPAAATALLEQVRNNNPSLKWPENPFAPE